MPDKQERFKETAIFSFTRSWCTAIGLVLVVSGLTACEPDEPPALSLEEAKKVTATFEGQSFVPPPKTIDDITAILDQEKPDAAKIAAIRVKLSLSPPAETGNTLAEFYTARGQAAEKLGNLRLALASFQTALKHVEDEDLKSWLLLWSGLQLFHLGRYTDSVQHFKDAISAIPDNKRGRSVSWNSALTSVLAISGDISAAEKALDQTQNAVNFMAGTRAWAAWGPFYETSLDRAKARVMHVRGQYSEAEPLYRSVLQAYEGTASVRLNPFARNLVIDATRGYFARTLASLDRFAEAEVESRKVLLGALKRTGKYSPAVGIALRDFVPILNASGRFAEAAILARTTLEIYQRMGADDESFLAFRLRNQIAHALAAQDQWKKAYEEFKRIEVSSGKNSESFKRFLGDSATRALIYLKAGDPHEAIDVAQRVAARNLSRKGPKHYETAEARGVLAMVLAASGDTDSARKAFAQALPNLMQRSRRSNSEHSSKAARDWRVRHILEAYIDLLSKSADPASVEESFRISQAARGQSVQRALSASSARASVKDLDLADLVRREQDALKQIGALNGLLANAVSVPTDQQNSVALADLRKRIDVLRRARAALAQEIEKRFPDYAALMNPKPATVPQAQKALRPGEALIATYVGENKTYVWAVPRSGKVAFATADLGRERAAAIIGQLRAALDPRAATLGDIPAYDVRTAHRLYKDLLAPVADGWKDARSLLVVAHGPLGQLPFSVLVKEQQRLAPEKKPLFSNYRKVAFLARSHGVTVVPSVSSLITLRGLPPASPGRRTFAGFGDPWFSEKQAQKAASPAPEQKVAAISSRGLLKVRGLPVSLRAAPSLDGVSSADLAKLPRLPDTADEVKSIALATNADLTRDVFTGRDASEGQVKSMTLSGYKVIAFATHGLVPGDLNGLSQPALALSSPRVAGGKDDGLLTMGEILSLKLDADWVVLSACNTASANGAGAEAVSGLGRAFFYAGTRALLVSNWPVETTSARALTTDIFKRQAKNRALSRAQALRQSMLNLIDKGGMMDAKGTMVFSYAHPIFWAPFSLVGDGGGGEPSS